MRVTFSNKLVFPDEQEPWTIQYVHHFRVGINFFIRYQRQGDKNWDIIFAGQKSTRSVPVEIREALMREFKTYIRQRVKKNVSMLEYKDFMEMAKAISL